MTILTPDQYYPCLAPLEQSALRLVYSQFVPTYFVIPSQPLKDLYSSSPVNFDGRLEALLGAFRIIEETVDLPPFPDPVDVWIGWYTFYLSWLDYPPINGGTDDTRCRESDYTLNPT